MEVRLAEVRPVKACLAEVRPVKFRLVEVRLAEDRPVEACLAEFRPGEARPAEVRLDVAVLVTPLVPGVHVLLEQCDMLVVRHRVSPLMRSLARAGPLASRRSLANEEQRRDQPPVTSRLEAD